jgi:TonB family protein
LKFRSAIGLLLLACTAYAQDSASDPMAGLDRKARFCRYDGTGVPGCITPPHATYQPDPSYPNKARKKRQQGTILLTLVVGTDGQPYDVAVDRGLNSDLDEAAVETVKRWRFIPASREGKPVAAEIKVEVSFKLY